MLCENSGPLLARAQEMYHMDNSALLMSCCENIDAECQGKLSKKPESCFLCHTKIFAANHIRHSQRMKNPEGVILMLLLLYVSQYAAPEEEDGDEASPNVTPSQRTSAVK